MEQLLNDFSPGLFFMQAIILLILIVLMGKFAWKPILTSLDERESGIKDALDAAEKAKQEMAELTAKNENAAAEARAERDKLIKEAKATADKMVADAQARATAEGDKMIAAAKEAIETEKKAALTEVKNQVAVLSIEVAEKILKKELSSKDAQKDLVDGLIKEVTLN